MKIYLREDNNTNIKSAPGKCFTGARLLEVDEVNQYVPKRDRAMDECWWTMTPSDEALAVFVVDDSGAFEWDVCIDEEYGIRPALEINKGLFPQDIKTGDKFLFGSYTFTMISNELALCDTLVGISPFSEDWEYEYADNYEESDAKKYVDNWFKETSQDAADIQNNIRPDSVAAGEADYGF